MTNDTLKQKGFAERMMEKESERAREMFNIVENIVNIDRKETRRVERVIMRELMGNL